MALQVGRALVDRADGLGRERGDRRLEARDLAFGHVCDAPAATGQQPARVGATRSRAVQQLLAEAHGGSADGLGTREDVDLAAPDDRHRPRDHRNGATVERVMAGSRASPDELVVVVAVWLARELLVAADLEPVQGHDLDRVGRIGESVEGESIAPGS